MDFPVPGSAHRGEEAASDPSIRDLCWSGGGRGSSLVQSGTSGSRLGLQLEGLIWQLQPHHHGVCNPDKKNSLWEAGCLQFPYASSKTMLGLTDIFREGENVHQE